VDFAVFVACAGAIGVAGPRLLDAIEAIAEETGIGRVWLGAIVLAAATSLPELVTTVSAGAIGEADLAVGAVFGSNMFNMMILGVFLAFRPWRRRRARGTETAVAVLAIGLAALTLLAVVTRDPGLGRVGGATVAVAVGYAVGSIVLYRQGRPRSGEEVAAVRGGTMTRRRPQAATMAKLGSSAALVFTAAVFLTDAAQGIAGTLGVSGGVVGVVALAFATSLPELVTSVAAWRRGASDLLVGNVLGSNVFNMAVLLPADVAFADGGILAAVSNDQAAPAAFGIALMLLALVALRSGWRPGVARMLGLAIVGGYVLGVGVTVALGVESG
jgi:cation:H+ antiporter